MSTRIRKWCQTLLLCCAAIVSLGWAPSALAVNNLGLFELDANTVDDSGAGLPDDWNNVFSASDGASVSVFKPDSTPRVFTGGSKDILDISGWSHRLGSSPPKSDLLNAYAAAYPSGQDLIIYFGADRASTNGTVTTGFWFFKNPISINSNGTFSGLHADGDVLVVADYDNGGKVGTIVVYEWMQNSGLTKVAFSQNLLGTPGLFCNEASGGTEADVICATTNDKNINVAWDGTLVPGQFFEGGINITKLIPGAACFSSFMATSRSSTTESAEIKNFILGEFPLCKLDVTKTCDFKELAAPNQARFSVFGQVTNSGFGTLSDISLTDVPALEAAPEFFTCENGKPTDVPLAPASLAPGAKICYLATTLGAVGQATFSDTITAHGTAGGATINSNGATATCQAKFEGLPKLSKSCVSCLDDSSVSGKVLLDTRYSGSLCNSYSFDFTNVKIVDTTDGTESASGITVKDGATTLNNGSFTLKAGTVADPTCVTYSGSYFPAHALKRGETTNTLNPDLAQFKDTITATGTRPFGSAGELLATQPADCNLCTPNDGGVLPARCEPLDSL